MFADLNLIHLFNFYLASMFVLSTFRRIGVYRAAVALVLAVPGRWPKLFALVKQHHGVFLTWGTVRPAALALLLTVVNVVLSRVVFPQADISLNGLLPEWWMLPGLTLAAAAMLAVDAYFVIRVGGIDRADLEKYFDQAEFWLTTWKAPVVRFVTFGYVNPRRMVDAEVRKALEDCSQLLNQSLYWVSLQVALRVLFGLLLWLAWALKG